MASIRSRRKKLTTLLTDVNTRLKGVELRSIGQQAASAASLETDENLVTPGSYLSNIAPATWKRVLGGWYYPKRVTGLANDRVELFLNVDAGLEVDETLEVSGINSPIEVSKKRKVLGVGQVVGDYRNNRPWYKPIPAGATHAVLYSLGAETDGVARALYTKAPIASFSATTTVATIVFSEPHNFNENDVVNVTDLGGNMAGIDGLFYVETVPSATSITYNFDVPLNAPIASTPATPNKFVFATVHEFVNLGDSWINTETDPDSLFIWNGIRWIAASDPSSVKKDDIDPGPPTNLQVSTIAYPNNGGATEASATFSWTAPTVNADGSELTDLGGYDVEWSGDGITGANGEKWLRGGGYAFVETSLDISGLPPGQTIQFRVRTIDTGGRKSVYASTSKLMGVRSDVLLSPSPPQATTRLGTVTVRWNGLQSNGSVPPNYLDYLEVHVGTTSSFTVSTATLAGRIDKSGSDFFVITDLPYNQPRYIRLVFVDKDDKRSLPSNPPVLVTTKPLVDVDIIGKILSGANIVPGSITASESIIGNTITGNLIQALTIEAGSIKANSLTADQIEVGALTAVTIRANAITAEKIIANAITADKIRANAITADKIEANAITAVKIAANSITATNGKIESLNAGVITAGTLTGRTVRTASSGRRVEISSDPENRIYFYTGAGLPVGQLSTIGSDLVLNRYSGANAGGLAIGSAGIEIFSGNQGPNAYGAGTFVGAANSLKRVTIGCTGSLARSGLYLDFPIKGFSGSDRYMIISSSGEVKYVSNLPGILSDSRLKNLISDEPLGINLISKLNPVSFNWKPETGMSDLGTKQFGLIAQEVEASLAELGISDGDHTIVNRYGDDSYVDVAGTPEDSTQMRNINYMGLVPILIKSTQELLARIETLESEVATLKEGKTSGS